MHPPTALVVGAGVSGPALALFLQRAGYAVTVHEARRATAPDTGSYFSLASNGRAVLDRLGLLSLIDRIGVPTSRMDFTDHRGHVLGVNHTPSTLIRRDRLSAILRLSAAGAGIPITYGSQIVAVDQPTGSVGGHGARPVARFADGSRLAADLIVGCDGIHSTVRRSVLADGPEPRFTGVIDGGGTARLPEPPPEDGTMRLVFGRRAFFAYQTLPGGEVAWFQNTRAGFAGSRREPGGIPVATWREHLLGLHEGDHSLIPKIITATTGPLHRWAVYELPSLPRWSSGAVGLIGDAAHAMPPHDGQGASMALEDALVLARCLRGGIQPAAALQEFEALRRERVEETAHQSNRSGRHKFPATERARQVRDQLLPHLLKQGVEAATRVSARLPDAVAEPGCARKEEPWANKA
ncbi:FAD-dependent monooxygenase [Streptomyces sp. NPDC033538]|uniref:FAD-dependent oxidoreductase n=1 Tax=Streptomyces sp. NPDC033538 TaxID=3155367 RepID=UPI0033E61F41